MLCSRFNRGSIDQRTVAGLFHYLNKLQKLRQVRASFISAVTLIWGNKFKRCHCFWLVCSCPGWLCQSKWKVFVPAHRFSVVWFKSHSQWQILLGAKCFCFSPGCLLLLCAFAHLKRKFRKWDFFFLSTPCSMGRQARDVAGELEGWGLSSLPMPSELTRQLLTASLHPTPVGTPQWQQPKKRGYLSMVLSITEYKEDRASFRDRGWPDHGAAPHWISDVDFAPWGNACPVDWAQVIKCSSGSHQDVPIAKPLHRRSWSKIIYQFCQEQHCIFKAVCWGFDFSGKWLMFESCEMMLSLMFWDELWQCLQMYMMHLMLGGWGSSLLLELSIALSQMTSLLRSWRRKLLLGDPINSPWLAKCWASPPPHHSGCGSKGQRQSVASYECPRQHNLG